MSRQAPSRVSAALQPQGWCLALLLALAAGPLSAGEPQGKSAVTSKAKPVAAKSSTAEPPAAPADFGDDSMEALRQRLAERLSSPRALAKPGAHDLQVTGKAESAPPAKAAVRPAAAAPAKKPAAAAHDWAYAGVGGPHEWGGLRADFALCGKGQRQSPIDIRGGFSVDLAPVRFAYRVSPFWVVDNGHTVQARIAAGNFVELDGRRYELQQLHFHRPSEERIDGRQFEMSLHLVHKDAEGRLAVVALLLERGPAHPAVQMVWNSLPLEKHQERAAYQAIDLESLLPADRGYYHYMGSLTTPPCSEGVQWVVMRHPVPVAADQIELFARIYPMNARPLQAAGGRRILQSN